MSKKEAQKKIQERLEEIRQNQTPEAVQPLTHPLTPKDLTVESYSEYMRRLNEARTHEANGNISPNDTSGKPDK